uniref:Glutamate receptor n=1 Tax=Zea mays TaxID=4577 RepID=A0A804MBC1_MAIZE
MKSMLQVWGIFCCVCSCALGQNTSARPSVVNVGALFTFHSTIGRAAKVAIAAAVNDINRDPSVLQGTKLVVQMQDTNYSGFISIVQALQFMEKDTIAIIGPQSSVVAHVISHVANELQFQMASVAAIVDYYGWKMVTAVYIDDDYGRNGVSSLDDELAKRRLKILYKAAIRPGARKSEMAAVLVKAAMMESRVFVLHARDDSGIDVFSLAYNLSMTSGGYVWIATDWLTACLDSAPRLGTGLLNTMQGVLTLRQHTENTSRKKALVSRWSEVAKEEEEEDGGSLPNTYGLYAYDTVWMLAHGLDAFFNSGGNISFSPDPRLRAVVGGALNLDALSVFDEGTLLLERIRNVSFMGATGPVKLDSDGNLIQPAYDIVNVVGSGLRTIGYWSNYSGLSVVSPETLYKKPFNVSANQELHAAIWPGETVTRPRGWVFPNNGNELRIGVPDRVSYRQFISVDNQTGTVGGFCIDVFAAAINLLQYPVTYRFVPFGNGRENPSYTELIGRILTNEFDAVVGDVAIVTNRTKVVDFTQPYVASGLVILTAVKTQSSDAWAFLQPFTIRMWSVTGVFFLVVGAVIWLLEHRINDDFRGPPAKQVITVFWFSFSTLFFAHREDTRSTLGRVVLTSPIKGIDSLIASDEPIGFQVGSFAESYLVHELGVSPSRLKALGTPDEYKNALELGPRKGGVVAIVDERPYVEVFLVQHDKFAIVGAEFTKSGWGFAFPRDSPLAVDLSTAILALSENGDLQRIHDKWLSNGPSPQSTTDLEPERLRVQSFSALFLLCGAACLAALAIHGCILARQYSLHVASQPPDAVATGADGAIRRSSRSSIRSFLSFADRREAQCPRGSCKDPAAALGGSSSSGVSSFTSSNASVSR